MTKGLEYYSREIVSQLQGFYVRSLVTLTIKIKFNMSFVEFYHLLGIRDRPEHLKFDSRLHDFQSNSEKAQISLNAAAIERHV